jgi:hypothetical protein
MHRSRPPAKLPLWGLSCQSEWDPVLWRTGVCQAGPADHSDISSQANGESALTIGECHWPLRSRGATLQPGLGRRQTGSIHGNSMISGKAVAYTREAE